MLGGNLASIGNGGIVSVIASLIVCRLLKLVGNIDCLQWPDNYDFADTRAINLPVVKTTIRYVANLEIEKKEIPFTDGSDDGETDMDDIDPSGLNKAFRFAAWSSVIMVRFIRN